MRRSSRPEKGRARPRDAAPVGVTILLVGILYTVLLATRVGPLDGVWSIDQGVRIEQIQSLLATRFRSLASVYPGDAVDPKHGFTPLLGQYFYRDGRSYSMFSAAWAVLNSLPYRFLSYTGLHVVPLVSTLGLLLVAARLTRGLIGTGWRLVLILVLGLATPLFFYSFVFWEHSLVSMLALLALYLAIREGDGPLKGRLTWSGALLGLAVWFRPEMVIAVPALAGALLLTDRPPRWRPILRLAAGAAAALASLFLFNQLAYGNFLGPHVLVAGHVIYGGQSLATLQRRRADWAAFLIAPPWPVVLTAIGALLFLRFLYPRLSRTRGRHQLLTLSAAGLAFIGVALLVQTGQGLETSLLVTAPLGLLWLLPWPGQTSVQAGGKRIAGKAPEEEARLNASSARTGRRLGLFAVLYVSLAFLGVLPDGGNQWGPRMLLPAVAPLVVAGFLRLAEWTRRPLPAAAGAGLVLAFLALASAGLFSELRGLRAIRTANQDARRFSDAVAATGERVVVCSDTIVPKLLAPIFYDGYLVFRAETAARFERLAQRLVNHSLRRLVLIDRPEGPVLPLPPGSVSVVADGPPIPLPKGYRLTVLRLP
ncbi:MAG: LA_3751/LA_3752 family putative glycosyltransferase [Thermoanaerobaculia bacterium]